MAKDHGPSVKDDEQYEKLRQKGESKEIAEPVGSSVLGYLVFGEVPGPLVLSGAAVLLIGVAGAVWGKGARSGTVPKPDGVPTRPD